MRSRSYARKMHNSADATQYSLNKSKQIRACIFTKKIKILAFVYTIQLSRNYSLAHIFRFCNILLIQQADLAKPTFFEEKVGFAFIEFFFYRLTAFFRLARCKELSTPLTRGSPLFEERRFVKFNFSFHFH